VSPLRGEKPQNRPLSKLNTGSFALRAMLPVKIGHNLRAVITVAVLIATADLRVHPFPAVFKHRFKTFAACL